MPTPPIVDDKSPLVIPFLLAHLDHHSPAHSSSNTPPAPFILGLNGIQGAGKTTLVTTLQNTLSLPPHNLSVLTLSIDDFYLPSTSLSALAASDPANPLLQHRGQPGTHDIPLLRAVFADLQARRRTHVPSYDKAARGGRGDRVPREEWKAVNKVTGKSVDVVLFEGWCVGFRALGNEMLQARWEQSRDASRDAVSRKGRLGGLELRHALALDIALEEYNVITDQFDIFVHVDAQDSMWVYTWRLEQEQALWESRGAGMTDSQVVEFVDGYYPSYELYTARLRTGVFNKPCHKEVQEQKDDALCRQLSLVVGKDRRVVEHHFI